MYLYLYITSRFLCCNIKIYLLNKPKGNETKKSFIILLELNLISRLSLSAYRFFSFSFIFDDSTLKWHFRSN